MITMPAEGSHERFLRNKFLPFITGFALVAGFVMFGVGVVVMNKEIAHAAISSVPIQTAPIVLLVAGILSLLVACLGIYYTCIKRNLTWNDMTTPLIVFLVLLVMAAILALVAGGVGLNHNKKLKVEFETDLKTKVEMYGKSGYETMANIDRLQKKDQCCGANYYTDWRATVYGGRRYDKVPDSCCTTYEYACGFKFKDETTINRRGCASIAVDKMNTHLLIIGVLGIVIGLIEAILWISFLCCYIKHKGPQGQDLKVEYRKTETPSGHESNEGAEDESTQEGDSSTAQGGDASTAQGGDAPGTKVKVHHRTAKTGPETSKTEKAKETHDVKL